MLARFTKTLLKPEFQFIHECKALAVAVSGGPDSMALAHLLSRWSEAHNGPDIHVLSVDHGLRKEAAAEAKGVGETVKSWPKTRHKTLIWRADKPDSKIQEMARQARYNLMAGYCTDEALGHLFLAHHQGDQAETFLFRLAKGSGLDGLACMRSIQPRLHLALCRPLLEFTKDELIAYCKNERVPFISDPSNENTDYARIRLRQARDVLDAEGLSDKRLFVTAMRMERARNALEHMTQEAFSKAVLITDTNRIVFNFSLLLGEPEEIVLRVILMAMDDLSPHEHYGPRMEKCEALASALMQDEPFKKRTLGGLIFSVKGEQLILTRENADLP